MLVTLNKIFYTWLNIRELHIIKRFKLTTKSNKTNITKLKKKNLQRLIYIKKCMHLQKKAIQTSNHYLNS